MLSAIHNSVEVIDEQPGKTQSSKYRQLKPKVSLRNKMIRVVNNIDNQISGRRRRNDKMNSSAGDGYRRDDTKSFALKHNDSTGITIS